MLISERTSLITVQSAPSKSQTSSSLEACSHVWDGRIKSASPKSETRSISEASTQLSDDRTKSASPK